MDLKRLIRFARKEGWEVERTRGGHLAFKPPGGGRPIVTSNTPSDTRAVKNHIARLRKAGLAVPHKGQRMSP